MVAAQASLPRRPHSARPIINILIVDDHLIVREGLKRILADTPELRVAGEAASAEQALDMLRQRAFDLLLLDLSMPGKNGIDLLPEVRAAFPHLPILVLSAFAEEQYALRVLKGGAQGFLNKESAAELLIGAIRKVASGGKFVSPALGERLAHYLGGDFAQASVHDRLSEREFVVLRLIARGKSLNDIAEMLDLSPKTISTYRSRIVEKTGLRSNAELARYALQEGLL